MNSDTRQCQGASNGGLKTQQSDCHSISAFIFLHWTGRLLGCLPFIVWSSLLFHCENSMQLAIEHDSGSALGTYILAGRSHSKSLFLSQCNGSRPMKFLGNFTKIQRCKV